MKALQKDLMINFEESNTVHRLGKIEPTACDLSKQPAIQSATSLLHLSCLPTSVSSVMRME